MIKSRGEQPVGRNSFDLLNRHVYTQKVAKITPVKALHTIPDDYFEVDMTEFSQNNIPMNTAAFLSGKKEMLAYFVPYNTIWHNFNQYQATREDPESAILQQKGIAFEPRISLYDLYYKALYLTIGAWRMEDFVRISATWIWYYTFRNSSSSPAWTRFISQYGQDAPIADLIQFMKDNHYANNSMSDYDHFIRVAQSNFLGITYNAANVMFGIDTTSYEIEQESEDVEFRDVICNMFGTPIWCDWIQKLDMLGYGNIYPLMHELRSKLEQRVDMILSGAIGSAHVTPSGFLIRDNNGNDISIQRLIDCILSDTDESVTLQEFYFTNIVSSTLSKIESYTHSGGVLEYVNVYPLYAYNKCFYDYMRNVYFDTDYNVLNYNIDFVDCRSFASSIIHLQNIPNRFFWLESHQWKKDMFTGLLPDNQLGQVSQVVLHVPSNYTSDIKPLSDVSSFGNYTSILNSEGNRYNAGVLTDESGNVFVGNPDQPSVSDGDPIFVESPHRHIVNPINTFFDVLALKRAEAAQQYAQDLMRAGNRTQDIFQQIYGVSPKSQLDEAPYFIEVASNDLNINPIIATASTGNENNGKLGDIAARSTINGGSLHFKFSTKDFGCVLFLSYIVPDSMYNSYRIDPHVTHLDPESHSLPYFQNLGLQPVYGEFLNNLQETSVRHRVLGYAPPYIEFKTDVDLVHGNLVDTYLPKAGVNDLDSEYQGSLSHWVVARTDMQQEKAVSLRNFYIDPRIVNNVFQFEAGSDYETDHYLTYCSIKVNAVRAFSELGLPRF